MAELLLLTNGALGRIFMVIIGLGLLLVSLYLLFRNIFRKHPIQPIYLIFSFLLVSLCFPSGIRSLFGIISGVLAETAGVFVEKAPVQIADTITHPPEIGLPQLKQDTTLLYLKSLQYEIFDLRYDIKTLKDDIKKNIERTVGAASFSESTRRANQQTIDISDSQSWYKAMQFLAAFLLIAFLTDRLVGYFIRSRQEAEPAFVDHHTSLRILLKNTVITLVIISALFFSITAIIAVPIIGSHNVGNSTLENQLKSELEAYSGNDQAIRLEYLDFIKDKYMILSSSQDSTIVAKLPSIDTFSNFRRKVDATFRKIDEMRIQAGTRMQITDQSNLTPSLKLKDKSELVSWYAENRASYLVKLDSFQNAIDYHVSDLYDDDFELYELIIDEPVQEPTPIPQKNVLGSDLGVFTYFTGWLLSVESYSLIIIIGLIGFGLLGAGGATFIRERERNNKQVLIDDIGGVLVKGFTAAIVVFLGVQGSLAVLTTEGADLNAYALFFVCFVAAVFSDDAWNWAHKRFVDRISTEEPVVIEKKEENETVVLEETPGPEAGAAELTDPESEEAPPAAEETPQEELTDPKKNKDQDEHEAPEEGQNKPD